MSSSYINWLELFSSFSFIFYGLMSFFSLEMKKEFKRWNISQFRVIVGIAQLIGGIGMIIGFYIPVFTLLASFGLSILMLLGFILRVMVKDGVLKSLPSLFYFLINSFIFFNFLKTII
jgi:hypothetical protein|tara:strand:+ start:325 stop:678 length:354 start_codon:yes stop_codon:yes gene_type:complete